ncbi:MAG: FtsX-like permease family protein [Alphaproteobacteria bacterium]|nr:FtsX-like permease family protein [Alphaproteobacteria bacterium]
MSTVWLAARLARRELRSGFAGFRIFFACLTLGVAAIAGIGSLAAGMLTGLASQGRELLGGDVSTELVHRAATTGEHAFLSRYGRVSEVTSMRAMAYALKNGREDERQLIELKAVDGAYPLYGTAALSPYFPLRIALKCNSPTGSSPAKRGRGTAEGGGGGEVVPPPSPLRGTPPAPQGENQSPHAICGAAAERTLLDRLHLSVGGTMRIGGQNFRVAAVLQNEPDRVSDGFSLGPHVLISAQALRRTGLVVPGSLIEYRYRVAMLPGISIARFKADAKQAFPEAGWQIRDRNDAAPGLRRFVEQITMFLTLVGLTALAVGGVGAGQAVSAFVGRKRAEIATLKSLGADGWFIFLTFFLQVMAIAVLAVICGLLVGLMLPLLLAGVYSSGIPIHAVYRIYPEPLVLAAAFGLLSAIMFSVPPLARAREIAPALLFRDIVARVRHRARLPYLAGAGTAGLAVIALAVCISPSPIFATWFIAGAAGALAVLRLLALMLRFALRKLPRPRRTGLRMALANLARPGSATADVIVALGLGLTLLATVSLLDRTISAQVKDALPGKAPTFYFVDIQPAQAAAFDHTIARFRSAEDYRRTPMIRGRITALNGVPAAQARVEASARWALNGDRGITYAATPPKGTEITQGKWWDANYRGPATLISFDSDLALGMHLKLGDRIALNVLGRDIEGRIANLRNVDFSNGRQNFVLILSPGLMDKAPHSFLATVRVAPREEEPMYRAVTDRFPTVSTVQVKDAIAQVNGILQSVGDSVRAASLVTILAGLLVLAGAIAAGQRARLYDSTVLKVLGATRARIAAIYALEYGLLGILTGALALAAGTFAAWLVARRVLDVPFVFDVRAALLTVLGGAAATLLFGLAAARSALSTRPAEQLRNP